MNTITFSLVSHCIVGNRLIVIRMINPAGKGTPLTLCNAEFHQIAEHKHFFSPEHFLTSIQRCTFENALN